MGASPLRMKSIQDTCRDTPKDRLTVYKLTPDRLDTLGNLFARRYMVDLPDAGNILRAICEEDDFALGRVGVSYEALSERLKSRILSPNAIDNITTSRGIEKCPFADVDSCSSPELSSAIIALTKPELDAALRFSHLLVHFVTEHVFFGFPIVPSHSGLPNNPIHARPLDLALILDLTDKETHARLTSEVYGDEITWRNRFWSIRELG